MLQLTLHFPGQNFLQLFYKSAFLRVSAPLFFIITLLQNQGPRPVLHLPGNDVELCGSESVQLRAAGDIMLPEFTDRAGAECVAEIKMFSSIPFSSQNSCIYSMGES